MVRLENCAWHILLDVLHVNSLPVCMLMTSSSPVQWVQGVQNKLSWLGLFTSLSPHVVQCTFSRKGALHNPGSEAQNVVTPHTPSKRAINTQKQSLPLTLVGSVGLSWNFSSNSGSTVLMARMKNHLLWLIQELWPSTVTQPTEILVMSAAWYCHVRNCKITVVFWGIEGESLDIEALTMKWMVHC